MPRLRVIVIPAFLLIALVASLAQFWLTYEMDTPLPAIVAGMSSALCLVALFMHLSIARWNRRFEGRLCPACGYDIRITPDRCPECGHEVTNSETPLPQWLCGTALDLARSRHR